MTKVIGVRFRTAGKIYFFAPGNFDIKRGSHVIVETARGIEYGTVVGEIREIEDEDVVQPLKPVLRIANERDDAQEKENKLKEKEAYRICLQKIQEHGLDMKLIDAEYTFDNNKVLFYFTSDGRVDFRELVKDLAGVFRTRIELRQVGVRDETKILGGIGICGRPLCCHTYLSEFIPVSIKMAKEQGLSLNPTKISGVCGRLMCCLKHEEETYEDLNRRLPNVNDTVTTPEGIRGEVHSVNVLRQKVKVLIENGDEKEIREYKVEELQFKKHFRREKLDVSEEELKLLKELEKQDKQEAMENEERSGKKNRKDRSGRNHSQDASEELLENPAFEKPIPEEKPLMSNDVDRSEKNAEYRNRQDRFKDKDRRNGHGYDRNKNNRDASGNNNANSNGNNNGNSSGNNGGNNNIENGGNTVGNNHKGHHYDKNNDKNNENRGEGRGDFKRRQDYKNKNRDGYRGGKHKHYDNQGQNPGGNPENGAGNNSGNGEN